jgi:hypothetical protein
MGTMRSRLKSGNALARVRQALAKSHKMYRLPPRENPIGVPRAIMQKLSAARLPCDVMVYDNKLQELLGGG